MERGIKTIKTLLKGLKNSDLGYNVIIGELYNITEEYGLEWMMDNVISEETIDYLIQDRMEVGGWQSVACLLAKVEYLQDSYYMLDGYGNIEDITASSLHCLLLDVAREIERLEEEES